jgi:hypothetical protein
MSIRDVINDWLDREEMFLLTPALESDPVDERMGRLRERLELFVRGDIITVAMDPFSGRTAYFARLWPGRDEVWEIRDRQSPSIRVFGSFSEPDTFVALTWQWRSILGFDVRPKHLRAPSTPKNKPTWPRFWRIERSACLAAWRQKFPSYQPYSGSAPSEYLTNWLPIGDLSRWQNK